jgi:peptidoglycan/LPS O-acetylase OafA/YrhL
VRNLIAYNILSLAVLAFIAIVYTHDVISLGVVRYSSIAVLLAIFPFVKAYRQKRQKSLLVCFALYAFIAMGIVNQDGSFHWSQVIFLCLAFAIIIRLGLPLRLWEKFR